MRSTPSCQNTRISETKKSVDGVKERMGESSYARSSGIAREKGVSTQGCSEEAAASWSPAAAAAVAWNKCREKEGLSSVGGMSRRDLDPHGGMGVCGSRISDRTFSRSESGEGRGGNEHGTFEMAKGAGFWREEEEGESGSVGLQVGNISSANHNFVKTRANYVKKVV